MQEASGEGWFSQFELENWRYPNREKKTEHVMRILRSARHKVLDCYGKMGERERESSWKPESERRPWRGEIIFVDSLWFSGMLNALLLDVTFSIIFILFLEIQIPPHSHFILANPYPAVPSIRIGFLTLKVYLKMRSAYSSILPTFFFFLVSESHFLFFLFLFSYLIFSSSCLIFFAL